MDKISSDMLFTPQQCPNKTLCLRKDNKPGSVLSVTQILKKVSVSLKARQAEMGFEKDKNEKSWYRF